MDEMAATDTDERSTTQTLTAAWFAAEYPQLHRVACVAAPADVDPDDLVQEALARLLGRSTHGIDNPAAYLTAMIVNLASNQRRSHQRRRRALALLAAGDTSRTDTYPSDLSELDQVNPRSRSVLYLHYVEGRPFAEIAELVGTSAAAARKLAERARRHLGRNEESRR